MSDRSLTKTPLTIEFDPGRTVAALRRAEAVRADILRRGLLTLLASPGAVLDAAAGAFRRLFSFSGVRLRQS